MVILSKVNLFIWRLLKGRLPTRGNLLAKGVHVVPDCCVFCASASETEEHVFGECSVSIFLIDEFRSWWQVCEPTRYSPSSIISWGVDLGWKGAKLEKFCASLYTMLWSLWNRRNSIAFGSCENVQPLGLDPIKVHALFWINSRGEVKVEWSEWSINP